MNPVTPARKPAKVISFAEAQRRRAQRRDASRGRHPAGHAMPPDGIHHLVTFVNPWTPEVTR